MSTQIAALDASVYDLPIPTVDGLKADKLRVSISGTVELDRTDPDDLAWFEAFKLGRDVNLELIATCTGKPQSFAPSEDGPGVTSLVVSLRAHTIRR